MYFSREHNTIVRWNDYKKLFPNISIAEGPNSPRFVTQDMADLAGLIPIEEDPLGVPEGYDERIHMLSNDFSMLAYDEENNRMIVKQEIVPIYEDEVDEDGNVVKTALEVKAEEEAARAAAEEAAWQQKLDDDAAAAVERRLDELASCSKYLDPDYTITNGTTVEQWQEFKDALTALVDIEGWPYFDDITQHWPLMPQPPVEPDPEDPVEEEEA